MWYWLDWLRFTGKGSDFFIADRPDLDGKIMPPITSPQAYEEDANGEMYIT